MTANCICINASFNFAESFHMTKVTFGRIEILVNNAEIRNDKFWELETDVNLVCKQSASKGFQDLTKYIYFTP